MSIFSLNDVTRNNLAQNTPYYIGCPGVNELENRFKGYPAIIVAAGPSLKKNIEKLKTLQGKAVIIAVATIYKALLANGIIPDFVCCLDYHEISHEYFSDIDNNKSALVIDPKVTWKVPATFKGKVFVSQDGNIDILMNAKHGLKKSLSQGSCVAHLCFYLADFLGCDPVILVGQDYAFERGATHFPGTPIHDKWNAQFKAQPTMEEWWKALSHRGVIPRKAIDINGNEIYTDEQMFNYCRKAQYDFFQSDKRVIDATEGGLKKEHCDLMTLEDASEFCEKDIPTDLLDVSNITDETILSEKQRNRFIRVLFDYERDCPGLQSMLRKAVSHLEEIRKTLRDKTITEKKVQVLEKLRKKIHKKYARLFNLVATANNTRELIKIQKDREVAALDMHGMDLMGAQTVRDHAYLSATVDSVQKFQNLMRLTRAAIQHFDFGEG